MAEKKSTAREPAAAVPQDPEAALLRHVVTLGTLIKILLSVGGVLVAIGAYEINQLDKLRDQATTLQSKVSELQVKVEANQGKLQDIQAGVEKSGNTINDFIKSVAQAREASRVGAER